MTETHQKPHQRSKGKNPKGKKGSNDGNPGNPAVKNTVAAPVEIPAQLTTGEGIGTQYFNSLLSNFSKVLAGANGQADVAAAGDNQILCEMGKLFLTSMMSFNQILQAHGTNATCNTVAGNSATGGSATTAPANTQENSKDAADNDNSNDKSVKGQHKPIQRKKRLPSSKKPPLKATERSKNETGMEAATSVQGNQGSSNLLPRQKTQKSNSRNTTGASNKDRYNRNKGAETGDKIANKPQRKNKASKAVNQPLASKVNPKQSLSETQSAASGISPNDVSKEDFNNAPTPNDTEEANVMMYLDSIVSPEKQLNFSIYQFVDSCTQGNGPLGKDAKMVEQLEWLPSQAVVPAAVSGPDSMDATCRTNAVIQTPAEFLKAAFMGDLELLKALESIDVNHVDEVGRSALHYASAAGSEKCVEHLLSRGININLADRKGWTAIHIAVSKNFTEVGQLLIKASADVFALLKHKCAPARLTDVYSPTLHFAAIKGNIEMTKLLLEAGALVNTPDSANMTPLHYAAFRNNPQYVKYLLDNGAKVDIKDVNGRTPYHAAALSGMVENVKLMVTKHPFINEEDVWSLTPYKLAELRNHKQFVSYLKGTLKITEEEEQDINRVISSTIAVALQEPNADQIYRCVNRIGAELCKTVFDLTMQIERNGGVLTADGSRRRTSGGIFFSCLRELYLNDIISKEDYNYIRAAENEKRIAKANERRSKLRSRS